MIGAVTAVVLGAVFTFSGALKLRDPGWPAAAAALGTPARLVPVVAPVELALGVLLMVGLWVVAGASAAIVLLLAFTAVLVRFVGRPDAPVCACFGRWSAKPVGVGSIVRNAALAGLAVVVLVTNL